MGPWPSYFIYVYFHVLMQKNMDYSYMTYSQGFCSSHNTLGKYFVAPKRFLQFITYQLLGFPSSSDGKASACNAGGPGSITGLGRSPGEGNGNPLQFLPGEFHGQKSLEGYNPWGHKELDTTEQLTHTHTHTHTSVIKKPSVFPINTLRLKIAGHSFLLIIPLLWLGQHCRIKHKEHSFRPG